MGLWRGADYPLVHRLSANAPVFKTMMEPGHRYGNWWYLMTLYWVNPSPSNSGILAFHLNVLGCTMYLHIAYTSMFFFVLVSGGRHPTTAYCAQGNAYLVISMGILSRKKPNKWQTHTHTQTYKSSELCEARMMKKQHHTTTTYTKCGCEFKPGNHIPPVQRKWKTELRDAFPIDSDLCRCLELFDAGMLRFASFILRYPFFAQQPKLPSFHPELFAAEKKTNQKTHATIGWTKCSFTCGIAYDISDSLYAVPTAWVGFLYQPVALQG